MWQLKRRWLWASFTEQADASEYFTEMLCRYARWWVKDEQAPLWHYWVALRRALDLLPEEERTPWNFWESLERVNQIRQEDEQRVIRTGNF